MGKEKKAQCLARMAEFEANLSPEKARAFSALKRTYTGGFPLDVLEKLPADKILNSTELKIYQQEIDRPLPDQEAPAQDLVLILKATKLCNLRCEYCVSWGEGPNQIMSFRTLVRTLREFLQLRSAASINFVWHGGEVTMLKPKFLKKALWLQEALKQPGQSIVNAVQTNATRLTDEWIDLLAEYDFELGISLDGPPEVNDRRRLDKYGRPTSATIERAIQKLRELRIPFGVLVVVDREIVKVGSKRVMDYLADIGVNGIHFVPLDGTDPKIFENDGRDFEVDASFVPYSEHIRFLEEGFEHWWSKYRKSLSVSAYSDLVPAVRKSKDAVRPNICFWQGNCMNYVFVVEPTGEIGPCDRYTANPNRFYGSIGEQPLIPMFDGSANLQANIQDMLAGSSQSIHCKWFDVCKGGCPHDRLLSRVSGLSDSPCCGLGPLLERIESTIAKEGFH